MAIQILGGFIPATNFERYPYEQNMWTFTENLPSDLRIIEEALNGTTAWDDPLNDNKYASRQLPFILDSHRPLDLISIMLGINDMKHYMNKTAIDSAMGIGVLIDQIKAADCGPKRECL